MHWRKWLALFLVLCLFLSTLPSVNAVSEGEELLPPYDITAAVNYALVNWNSGFGQCAQFVSNCLLSGGITVPNGYDYYQADDHRYWGTRLGEYTSPLVCAAALLKWLAESHPVIVNPSIEQMELGDIVFMDDVNPDGHTAIITGFAEDGMPLYCAHNPAAYNQPVNDSVNFLVKMQVLNQVPVAAKVRPVRLPIWLQESIAFAKSQKLIGGFFPSDAPDILAAYLPENGKEAPYAT